MPSREADLAELLLEIPRGGATVAGALGLHPAILDRLTDKALAMLDLGKLDDAERLIADLANVDGASPVLPFLLGACREQKADLPGAIEAYGEGIARAERARFATMIPRARICRGRALLALGRAAEARVDFEAVAASDDAVLAKEAQATLARVGA